MIFYPFTSVIETLQHKHTTLYIIWTTSESSTYSIQFLLFTRKEWLVCEHNTRNILQIKQSENSVSSSILSKGTGKKSIWKLMASDKYRVKRLKCKEIFHSIGFKLILEIF